MRWVIEHKGDDYTGCTADRARFDGGAVIFEDGPIFTPELVLAFGPGRWVAVFPEPDGDHSSCDHE